MTILDNLAENFRVDVKKRPSTEDEIKQLESFSAIPVPAEYVDLIRSGSEFEILVKGEVYIRIWGAAGCLEMNEAYGIQGYLSGSLAVGDNGGGSALIYMPGMEGFGVYLVGFGCLDAEEAIYIAPSLHDLFVNNIGIDRIW